jgi:ComEC/Rec2-related protein
LLVKRPLVPVALSYAGGVLLAEFFQPPLIVPFAAAFVFAVLALSVGKYRPVLLWGLIVCCGWANMAWRTAVISPFDLRLTYGAEPKLVRVRGVLADRPDVRVRPASGDDEEFARTLAVLEVTEVREMVPGDSGEWCRAHGRVLATTYGRLAAEYRAGTEVQATGRLELPPSPVAKGLFDYRQYLKRQGIYHQLRVQRTEDWRLLPTGEGGLSHDRVAGFRQLRLWAQGRSEAFLAWAQKTLARGLPEEDEALRLLWAMTLGWKTGMTNEVYAPFMRSGTMHIFAISGLHIALIAGVLLSVLRVLRVPRGGCGLISIPLIWFYTGATGWQPSAVRAALMMTVVIGGWALRRPSDLVNSLAAAGLMILLWEPRQLFGASFQLSFFVVLSIALLVPPVQDWVQDWVQRRLHTEPLLPVELLPRGKRWAVGLAHWIVPGVATSVAAWLGAWPLTLHYFHLVSWVTLPVNLLVVPLSGVALASNLGALVCGSWLPWATELFNHSAWFWMVCMVRLSEWACLAPGGYRYAPALCGPGLAFYYALLVGVISGWLLAKERRRWVLPAAGLLALILVGHVYVASRTATLTVLPLDGSVGLVCEDADGYWVADPGRTNSVRYTVAPLLHARGVNVVQRLVLTHGDAAHVSGAELFADEFRVSEVVVPAVRFRSIVYRRALERIDAKHQARRTGYGDALMPGIGENRVANGRWRVLHPVAGERYARADDAALVLAGSLNGTRVLLVSDLGEEGQRALLDRGCDLAADVVISGLPSNGQALLDEFLDTVRPKVVVIGDSELPLSECAGFELRERLKARGVKVFYTSETGAVTLRCWKGGKFECSGKNGS